MGILGVVWAWARVEEDREFRNLGQGLDGERFMELAGCRMTPAWKPSCAWAKKTRPQGLGKPSPALPCCLPGSELSN